MAIDRPETGRPAGRAQRAAPQRQRRTDEGEFLVSRGRPKAGEETRPTGCGSRPGFGQIKPIERPRKDEARRRETCGDFGYPTRCGSPPASNPTFELTPRPPRPNDDEAFRFASSPDSVAAGSKRPRTAPPNAQSACCRLATEPLHGRAGATRQRTPQIVPAAALPARRRHPSYARGSWSLNRLLSAYVDG
jgi:hypothetical protein